MSKTLIGGLVAAGTLALVVLLTIFGYIGFTNDANAYEADIPAQYEQMKNVYDNGWKEVMEVAQVPENYRDDMKSVWQAALSGRYGDKGSQAVLQFIKESNPSIDSSLYKKVQEKIESFHSNFSATQTKIISQKQSYKRFLTTNTNSRFYNMLANYPHIKCGSVCGAPGDDDFAILTSGKTDQDFKSHKADPLQLRK
jgi:hypothetical protein